MGLRGSIKVGNDIYREDLDNGDNVYHVKENAQKRAKELREDGYLVRVVETTCTEGSESAWQVFKKKVVAKGVK